LATQLVHVWQSCVVQHCCSHCAGGLLAIAHRWKHPIDPEHCASAKHAWVASQHDPTTHWLHGVPPGSSPQLPESMSGVPHSPPWHVRPMQHCEAFMQFEPLDRHEPPQTPIWH
jgi:hypothetical protein